MRRGAGIVFWWLVPILLAAVCVGDQFRSVLVDGDTDWSQVAAGGAGSRCSETCQRQHDINSGSYGGSDHHRTSSSSLSSAASETSSRRQVFDGYQQRRGEVEGRRIEQQSLQNNAFGNSQLADRRLQQMQDRHMQRIGSSRGQTGGRESDRRREQSGSRRHQQSGGGQTIRNFSQEESEYTFDNGTHTTVIRSFSSSQGTPRYSLETRLNAGGYIVERTELSQSEFNLQRSALGLPEEPGSFGFDESPLQENIFEQNRGVANRFNSASSIQDDRRSPFDDFDSERSGSRRFASGDSYSEESSSYEFSNGTHTTILTSNSTSTGSPLFFRRVLRDRDGRVVLQERISQTQFDRYRSEMRLDDLGVGGISSRFGGASGRDSSSSEKCHCVPLRGCSPVDILVTTSECSFGKICCRHPAKNTKKFPTRKPSLASSTFGQRDQELNVADCQCTSRSECSFLSRDYSISARRRCGGEQVCCRESPASEEQCSCVQRNSCTLGSRVFSVAAMRRCKRPEVCCRRDGTSTALTGGVEGRTSDFSSVVHQQRRTEVDSRAARYDNSPGSYQRSVQEPDVQQLRNVLSSYDDRDETIHPEQPSSLYRQQQQRANSVRGSSSLYDQRRSYNSDETSQISSSKGDVAASLRRSQVDVPNFDVPSRTKGSSVVRSQSYSSNRRTVSSAANRQLDTKGSSYPAPAPLIAGKGPSYPPPAPLTAGKGSSYPPPAPLTVNKGSSYPPPAPLTTSKGSSYPPPAPLTASKGSSYPPPAPLTASKGSSYPPPAPLTTSKGSSYPPPAPLTAGKGSSYPPPAPLTVNKGSSYPPPAPLTTSKGSSYPPPAPLTASKGSSYPPPEPLTASKGSSLYRPSALNAPRSSSSSSTFSGYSSSSRSNTNGDGISGFGSSKGDAAASLRRPQDDASNYDVPSGSAVVRSRSYSSSRQTVSSGADLADRGTHSSLPYDQNAVDIGPPSGLYAVRPSSSLSAFNSYSSSSRRSSSLVDDDNHGFIPEYRSSPSALTRSNSVKGGRYKRGLTNLILGRSNCVCMWFYQCIDGNPFKSASSALEYWFGPREECSGFKMCCNVAEDKFKQIESDPSLQEGVLNRFTNADTIFSSPATTAPAATTRDPCVCITSSLCPTGALSADTVRSLSIVSGQISRTGRCNHRSEECCTVPATAIRGQTPTTGGIPQGFTQGCQCVDVDQCPRQRRQQEADNATSIQPEQTTSCSPSQVCCSSPALTSSAASPVNSQPSSDDYDHFSFCKSYPLSVACVHTRQLNSVPTIQESTNFDPDEDARRLKSGFELFYYNADDDLLIEILTRRTFQQRGLIKTAYYRLYSRDLIEDVESSTRGNFGELMAALLRGSSAAEFLAESVRAAVDGAGTDEDTVLETLISSTNQEIDEISRHYRDVAGKSLAEDVEEDFSGELQNILLSLVKGTRDPSFRVDYTAARQQAQALYQAGEGRLGTDEGTYRHHLTHLNYAQLALVMAEYERATGNSFEEALQDEFARHEQEAVLAIVQVTRNLPEYLAERVHDALWGRGPLTKDDSSLIRILVARAETDLATIANIYQSKYGRSLVDDIETKSIGDYENALVALVRGTT